MAVNDKLARGTVLALFALSIACAAMSPVARSEPASPGLGESSTSTAAATPRKESWREGVREAWRETSRQARRSLPDWLHRRSRGDVLESIEADHGRDAYVALQEDRPDGTELMTWRYRIDTAGAVTTYAGAGISRSRYFRDDGAPGPAMLARRNRHNSLGAAAEIGAECRLSERLQVNADLRWADLDEQAAALQSRHGPVVAEPLLLGVSVGYRFR